MGRSTLAIACLAVMATALAQDAGRGVAQEPYDELEQVLIVGERTPPLWKLTRKGHVLWILGTYRPQPRNVQLKSQRLSKLISESQEVILPGFAYVASSNFGLMPEIMKSDRNPAGVTLKDLMPADAYTKWVTLRQKYSNGTATETVEPKFNWGISGKDAKWVVLTQSYRGGDGIDSMRPTMAWEALRRAAMDRLELANYDIEGAVSDIAMQHKIPVRRLRVGRTIMFVFTADPLLKEYGSKNFNAAEALNKTDFGDVGCLTGNLDLLEPVLEMQKARAGAWARGDIQAFSSADTGLRLNDCMMKLVASVSVARLPGSSDAEKAQERYFRASRNSAKEVQEGWIDEVRDAVKKNTVTFSVVPIDRLLADDGYLAALRDKGFVLEDSGPGDTE
ncbi:MAG: TraB/GumN family protein [Pseudomonadota bacterium]